MPVLITSAVYKVWVRKWLTYTFKALGPEYIDTVYKYLNKMVIKPNDIERCVFGVIHVSVNFHFIYISVRKMVGCVFLVLTSMSVLSETGAATLNEAMTLGMNLMRDYDQNFRPALNNDDLIPVQVEINIISINNFDDITGLIDMTTVLHFMWQDRRLTWNNVNGIGSLILPVKGVWRPEIVLENAADRVENVGKESLSLRVDNDGRVLWNFGQVLRFTCSVNVKYYPFDTQTCYLLFKLYAYKYNEVKLEAFKTSRTYDYFTGNPQWEFITNNESAISTNPQKGTVKFEFQLKRRYDFFLIYIICPILLLSIINDLVFVMPITTGERMGVAITSYLSYAVYMSIINEHVPENSAPIPLVFVYLILLLAHSSLIMVLIIISARIYDREEPVSTWIQKVVRFLRYKNCKRRQRKVATEITNKERMKCTDVDSKVGKKETDSISETLHAERDEISWEIVGRVFDFYMFLLVVILHVGLSVGYIYSMSVNDG